MNPCPISATLFRVCLVVFWLTIGGCGEPDNPLKGIEASLKDNPSYSVVLEDMKEEGNFLKEYYHKYKVVQEEDAQTTDWLRVPESLYQDLLPLLGMVVAGRVAGELLTAAAPPAYPYVGNTRYGSWRSDSTGRSYWAFNQGLPLIAALAANTHPPIYRSDYDAYRQAKSVKQPYFGPNNAFGTSGSWTQKNKPDFFQRRMALENAKKASFAQKVNDRVGRTKTGFRGRSSSGGGK